MEECRKRRESSHKSGNRNGWLPRKQFLGEELEVAHPNTSAVVTRCGIPASRPWSVGQRTLNPIPIHLASLSPNPLL